MRKLELMKDEYSSTPKQPTSRLRWLVGIGGALGALRYLLQDAVIFDLPYCAWRFIGNGDAWNVAYPDGKSIYHVMQLRMGENDVFRIVGESFPYARYMSYQTYDIPGFMSQMSLRDMDVVPDFGVNAYSNLTAAVNGEKQGGYTLYITPHGDRNLTNELRALPLSLTKGHFDLFLRIYVEDGPPPPQAPWSHLPADGEEDADKWGWAPPPRVYVLRRPPSKVPLSEADKTQVIEGEDGLVRPVAEESEWKEITMCTYRRRKGFKWVAYLAELAKPAIPLPKNYFPNQHDNFLMPNLNIRKGKFASKDANYLAAAGDASTPGQRLYARITGKWPRTAGSLYSPPYIANFSDYDVRYTSLSSASRNPPFMNFGTISDSTIIRHYREKAEQRGGEWDGSFVVWMVPPDVDTLPAQVTADEGLTLKWGKDPWTGRSGHSSGLLYRQVMAQSQVLDSGRPHPSGIANVVPDQCPLPTAHSLPQDDNGACPSPEAGLSGDDEPLYSPSDLDRLCCQASKEAPSACYTPRRVAHLMEEYYPRIEYFSVQDDDPNMAMHRLPDDQPGAV